MESGRLILLSALAWRALEEDPYYGPTIAISPSQNRIGPSYSQRRNHRHVSAPPLNLLGELWDVSVLPPSATETARSTALRADLSGGALACLAVVPLLNWLGGPEYDSGFGYRDGCGRRDLGALLKRAQAGLLWRLYRRTLIAANHSNRLIDVILITKGMSPAIGAGWNLPAGTRCRAWKWIARVGARPLSSTPMLPCTSRAIVLRTGTIQAGSAPHVSSAGAGDVPLIRTGSSRLSGRGGGVDVLRAVANGSPSVTGIEINPIIADTIMPVALRPTTPRPPAS